MEKTQVEIKIGLELHIQLLGKFSVSVKKITIPEECWRSRRPRSLVKLLALTPGHRLHRDQIIETLWANSDLAVAANNFYQTLYTARRVLESAGASVLALEEGFLSLAQADGQALTVDLEQFEAATAQAKGSQNPQTYQDALALYSGDLLPDDLYEEWTIPQREAQRLAFLQLLLDLAGLHETRQEYPQGISTLQQVLSLEKSREEAHAGLMRLYALSGQHQQAVRQYQTLREVLYQELEAEPSQSTSQLYEAIQKGDFSPPLPKIQSVHNLPVQVTSFIGREKEIETLKQVILSGQTRLVTVTGAGGTGKTRLALRAAEELLDAFPQGLWLVELAAVADPNLVPGAVASILGLREGPDKSFLQMVVDFLSTKQTMVILDTCEHLVDAVANLVERILHASPQVVILTTSREILGIQGEMPFFCPNLALPAPHLLKIRTQSEQLKSLLSCEAVRLFAERSALTAPGFVITEKNAPIIAQICRRLDGIPLAIELAAARMRILSIEQIAERLDHAFVLLTGGSRTALPRQQTLKATIDWSYNLLTPAERALLLRLSIFSGGWMLEAAEVVCVGDGPEDETLLPEEILDLSGRLADKSLILVDPWTDGEPRYRMLDTIRQYAHERLLEIGGESLLRDRHLAYYRILCEQAQPLLRTRSMVEWLKRLEAELGNLRLALEWSLSGSFEQGMLLASALFLFWHLHSRRFEGIQWLERLLEADSVGQSIQLRPPSSRFVRGIALVASGNLNQIYPGIYSEHAQAQLKEGKSIIRELDDLGELGDLGLKYLLLIVDSMHPTEEEVKENLALARKLGNEIYTERLLLDLKSFSINPVDLAQVTAITQEYLVLCQKLGDVDGEAFVFNSMANTEFFQGNPQRALELLEASQRCFQAIDNIEFSLYCSSLSTRIALAQGDYRRALELSEAKLAAGQEISSSLVMIDALGHLCWTYWAQKDYDRIAQRCEEILGPGWENNLPCGRGTLFYVFGRVALSQGQYARACTYLKHVTEISYPEKYLGIQALGILAAMQGDNRQAAVIFGAVENLFYWLKNVSCPAERDEYQQALASTQDALGKGAFAAAWAEGQGLTLQQLESLALDETG